MLLFEIVYKGGIMNKNLLIIMIFQVLVVASVTREEGSQLGAWATYGIKSYSSSVLDIMYKGNAIKDNEVSKRAIEMHSQQKYGYSALELMYKKKFENFDH